MKEHTIPQMFEDSVDRFGDNVYLWEKKSGHYEGLTYSGLRDLVYPFAAGLMSLGIEKGDRVALISEGRNDWVMSELGVLYAGAVNVPISVKVNELQDLTFRLAHSGCKMAIVSGSQADKLRAVKKDLADLETIIFLDKPDSLDKDEIFRDEILSRGKDYLRAARETFESRWSSLKESDYANLCYTSGTTADPKGIILTHRNYTANVEQSNSLVKCDEDDVTLLILPWDHAFAHTCGIYTMMRNGASLAAVQPGKTPMETLRNIPVNIKEIKPTLLLSVPALAKSFRRNIENGVKQKGPKVNALFQRALKTAYQYNREGWNKGQGWDRMKKPLLSLYDTLIFKKIRENFGGRMKFFIGGGALLDIEMQRFFYAVGMPMFQGYGLTEAAPVISSNSQEIHKLGTSGVIAEGMEVRILDEDGNEQPLGEKGEICVRGENVMLGYWHNEKATAETLRDGWLHTGDLGYMDADGFLYVLGREKSLLIGNDGEKYSPEAIEEALTEHSPFIEQIMLYNDQSPYTAALLVPNSAQIKRWTESNHIQLDSKEGQDAVLKRLEDEVAVFQPGGEKEGMFPQRWLPSSIGVLGEGFTEENRFLNSTMKMVRPRITEYYKNRINYMYTPEGKNICNPQNRTIVSRLKSE